MLTPAELINTIAPFKYNTNIQNFDDIKLISGAGLKFTFFDSQEFDNYNQNYFKMILLNKIIELRPCDEIL